MPRLPTPGSDSGTWGTILNEFLKVSLKTNGTIKDDAVTAAQVKDDSLTGAQLQSSTIPPSKLQAVDSPANGEVLAYNNGQFEWVAANDVGAKVLVLNAGDPVPGGTPAGTVILRRA